jgi:hypothetical protein
MAVLVLLSVLATTVPPLGVTVRVLREMGAMVSTVTVSVALVPVLPDRSVWLMVKLRAPWVAALAV